ncbi:MAG: 3-oxoacyl-ACP reductase [Solirubrobacterales bacterium]|nr:3-oxoacyl-ACP reductase [Solirubrobacterales bacterium]
MDRYTQLINTPVGRVVARNTPLPAPVPLERHVPGEPVLSGRALLSAAPGADPGAAPGATPGGGGRLARAAARVLAEIHAEVSSPLRAEAADAGLDAAPWTPQAAANQRYKALIFDATAIAASEQLGELRAFFAPTIRQIELCGRVVVLGTPPQQCATPAERIAQRALEGFVRSVGKEVRRGATAQLVYVSPGAEDRLASTLRFLLSPRSAYVSGQVIRVGGAGEPPAIDWERPLADQVALVTGASRGIGASIAATLARDGAHVVGVDVPALADELRAVTDRVGGSSLTADITEPDAPAQIAEHLSAEHGGVDVVVHNAGITRDRTLGRMDEERFNSVIAVNLTSIERIDEALVGRDLLRGGGRIVCVSSMNGIAGNAGQTNYATSKAGVIGLVEAYAPLLERATINAVAPGFIETRMTAAMPLPIREAGRRMSSLAQGGLPVDVAETVAWLACPASAGINGNVVRVCGQSLIGA